MWTEWNLNKHSSSTFIFTYIKCISLHLSSFRKQKCVEFKGLHPFFSVLFSELLNWVGQMQMTVMTVKKNVSTALFNVNSGHNNSSYNKGHDCTCLCLWQPVVSVLHQLNPLNV